MKQKSITLRAAAVLTLVILLAALPLSTALAIPAGPLNARTGANVAGVGTAAWSNPGNITAVGSPYATANVGSGGTSQYLRGTNYGFTIPDGSTINGITVVINRQSSGTLSPFISDNVVRLVRGGTIVGTNMATAANWPTGGLGTATYGSTGELWGTTWTPADINNANFGVVLSVNNLNGFASRTATVDYIQVTVEYTLPGTTTIVNCGAGTPTVNFGSTISCVATVTSLAGGNTPAGTVSWTTDAAGTIATSPCTLAGTGASATCSVNYTPTAIGDGTHLLTATYGGNVNFTGSNGTQTVTVNPRPVTVTADPQTKVYYDPDPTLTYQITSGSLLPGDAFTGALTRVAGEDVGPYAIGQGTLALPANYALTFVGANLTITPYTLTVTADPQTKVYGELDPALTYQYDESLLAPGDEFSGALTSAVGENVGPYAIQQGTLTLGDNYTIDFVSDDLTITPRPLTVTANPQTKVYGTADPALTYAVTTGSLLPGDAFTGALARAAGEDVDVYAIGQGTLANANYTITYVGANLTVTARPVTVTADAQTKVYGAADPTLTYQVTSGSLAFTDAFTGALARAAGENVNSYAIGQGTLNLGTNYTLTFVGANLAITARPVTVTADTLSKVYGTADPSLTYQVTSGSLAFTDAFTGALARAAGENVNTYAIGQGTLALTANYTLTYVGANFTITPRPVTVTADPKTKVYGAADPALTYQVTSGTVMAGDVFTGTITRAAGEAVDVYAIGQGTLALTANYSLSFVGADFTITPRPVTVTADPKTKMFGAADPALTYQVTSGTLLAGDVFTGSLTREPGEAVAVYAIRQGSLALPGYYTLTYVGANFTITPAGPALTLTKTAAPSPLSNLVMSSTILT